ETRERYAPSFVSDPEIPIERQCIVDEHARAEQKLSLPWTGESRNHDGHGAHQVRREPKQTAALRAGTTQSPKARMLQVTDAAMDELVRVGRHARAEIRALDERDRQPSQRCVPRGAGAEDAAAYDQHVEDTTIQSCKVSARHFRFQKQERVTS